MGAIPPPGRLMARSPLWNRGAGDSERSGHFPGCRGEWVLQVSEVPSLGPLIAPGKGGWVSRGRFQRTVPVNWKTLVALGRAALGAEDPVRPRT